MNLVGLPLVAIALFALFESSQLPMQTVYIDLNIRKIPFQVEIAKKTIHKMRGLMYRDHLGDKNGMLFIYEDAEVLSFWMAHVRFPLDILFIDRCGQIVSIHPMAKPYDMTIITSQIPVSAALEIHGGSIGHFGINVGDRVIGHPAITCEYSE